MRVMRVSCEKKSSNDKCVDLIYHDLRKSYLKKIIMHYDCHFHNRSKSEKSF